MSVEAIACPLQTHQQGFSYENSHPGELHADIRAYKLGKKRWSYNQVDLQLRNAAGTRVAVVQQAVHASSARFPEAHQDSAVAFIIQLESGQKLQAHVYVCFGQEAAAVESPAPASDGQTATPHFAWNLVTRQHCCKGCEGPVLRAIQRFGRAAKRTPAKRTPSGSTADAPTEPEGQASSSSGPNPKKDPKFMYLSLDEACTHVDATAFRLVAGIYNRQGNRLLTTAVSPPIRVLANNDVPTGAARIRLEATLPADWEGWGSKSAGKGSSSPRTKRPRADAAAPQQQTTAPPPRRRKSVARKLEADLKVSSTALPTHSMAADQAGACVQQHLPPQQQVKQVKQEQQQPSFHDAVHGDWLAVGGAHAPIPLPTKQPSSLDPLEECWQLAAGGPPSPPLRLQPPPATLLSLQAPESSQASSQASCERVNQHSYAQQQQQWQPLQEAVCSLAPLPSGCTRETSGLAAKATLAGSLGSSRFLPPIQPVPSPPAWLMAPHSASSADLLTLTTECFDFCTGPVASRMPQQVSNTLTSSFQEIQELCKVQQDPQLLLLHRLKQQVAPACTQEQTQGQLCGLAVAAVPRGWCGQGVASASNSSGAAYPADGSLIEHNLGLPLLSGASEMDELHLVLTSQAFGLEDLLEEPGICPLFGQL